MECLEIGIPRDQSIRQLTQKPLRRTFSTISVTKNFNQQILTTDGFKSNQNKKNVLKNIISKHRVNSLTQNFIKKARRNSIYRTPIEDNDSTNAYSDDGFFVSKIKRLFHCLGVKEGLGMGNAALAVWSFVNILQITFMVFIFSIMVTFPETENFQIFLYFRIFSVILYVIDMILNFITQRYQSGETLKTLGEIAAYYLKNGFIIDLISILIFPIDLLVEGQITIFISFLALIKLASNLKKFEKFEYLYITTSEREQYYGLIKVFLMNFTIGHFLSIFLNLMAYIQENNWTLKLGITASQWYIKYIWGYYWGTNIMLTVGFGDLSASNYYQAIILIFIQTFSCITLAYNISYVGGLITSMKENQQSKKRKMKTFHKMCKENQIPNQIETKISNFIDESYRIKETFEHDYEEQVMNFLPKSMQLEYRKQSNKILFDNVGFLNNISKKSLVRLAESITRKICHPEEVIVKKGSFTDFIILRKGELGMACRTNSLIDGKVIQVLTVSNQDHSSKPKMFSLDFIKNKTINFNLKSLNYSDIYLMSRQQFMQALKGSDMDYELFCILKDRQEYILDQNQLYRCSVCKKQFHNKFKCPKLHFLPISQLVIARNLKKENRIQQHRFLFNRKSKYKHTVHFKPMLDHDYITQGQKKYLKDFYDDDSFDKIQDLMQFYFKIKVDEAAFKNKHKRPSCELSQSGFGGQKQQMLKSETESIDNVKMHSSKKDFQEKNFNPFKTLVGGNRTLRQFSNKKMNNDDRAINLIQELLWDKRRDQQISFWDLEVDQAHNFKYYFTKNNPDNLPLHKNHKKMKNFSGLQKLFH